MAKARRALNVRPAYKRIDTCAAEFASPTPTLYSTYETPFAGVLADEAQPSDREKVVILGGGPPRTPQPYRGVSIRLLLLPRLFRALGRRVRDDHDQLQPGDGVDDYDTSDRLYFESLTAEDVIEILEREKSRGTLKA